MSKGRLIKAQFLDQPVPNVSWFWIGIGNCLSCEYYESATARQVPHCSNPKMSDSDFHRHLLVDTCPVYKAGLSARRVASTLYESDKLDVMKAAGLVRGESNQRVTILQNLPWSEETAEKAYAQQKRFKSRAMLVDSGHDNNPKHQEYDDLSDTL